MKEKKILYLGIYSLVGGIQDSFHMMFEKTNSPLLFPLGNEVFISQPLLQCEFVQLLGDGLSLVEKIVEVSRSLMVNL